jgi:hypothetical protein
MDQNPIKENNNSEKHKNVLKTHRYVRITYEEMDYFINKYEFTITSVNDKKTIFSCYKNALDKPAYS